MTKTSGRRARRPAQTTGGAKLDDVARLAGVSAATVSRAINTPDMVAAETRERVARAVAETGYVPNLLAGGLASARSRLVAAFVPSIATSIFNDTIEAMTGELAAAGYLVLLGLLAGPPEEIDRTITSILARRPDGLILTSAERASGLRQRLKTANVTVVETWDLPARPLDVAIGFSHLAVGRTVAEAVAAKGYRAPLVITTGTKRARERMAGFLEAYRSLTERTAQCDVNAGAGGELNGRARYAAFLDSGGKADVIICSSDAVAVGVLTEAAARGIRVPAELAVVGFGDARSSANTFPPLTTVRIDGAEIGRQAARVLLDRSTGVEPKRRRIDVGFELVMRESL